MILTGNKKGITLLETVIAMVLVSIISVSALSIALSSNSAETRTNAKYLCVNESYNILSAFQNSNNLSTNNNEIINNFETNLTFCYGENNWNVLTQTNNKIYTIYFDTNVKATTSTTEFVYVANIEIENYSTLKMQFKQNINGNLKLIFKSSDYITKR